MHETQHSKELHWTVPTLIQTPDRKKLLAGFELVLPTSSTLSPEEFMLEQLQHMSSPRPPSLRMLLHLVKVGMSPPYIYFPDIGKRKRLHNRRRLSKTRLKRRHQRQHNLSAARSGLLGLGIPCQEPTQTRGSEQHP